MSASPFPSGFDGLDGLSDDEETDPDFERLWTLLQRADAERGRAYDVDREWNALADRLDLDDQSDAATAEEVSPAPDRRDDDRSPQSHSATRPALSRWATALTVIMLAVGIIGGGLWWGSTVSVQTPPGERRVVTLPDGSTAELNGATTLAYPRGFTSLPVVGTAARTVHLDGEAFFDVTERERAFRVETANAEIEVLGTAFNVRARDEEAEPETRVAVESGRVRLQAAGMTPDSSASVVLERKGQVSYVAGPNGRPSRPRTMDLKYVEAWRQGGFALAGAALPTVLRELERRFGTSLQLRVPRAETDTMTLHYARDAQLSNVLRDICLIQGLSYRETSQGYELVGAEAGARPSR